jgi:hypothetical protein
MIHPLFEAILRPYTPPPPPNPSPEAIDRAMLADKLADGYFQRQINNAIKLELRYANPEN